MSVLLIAPLFEALGITTAIGTLATELGVGAVAGNIASGALIGGIGDAVDKEISKKLTEEQKALPGKVKNTIYDITNSLMFQDPSYILKGQANGTNIFKTPLKVFESFENDVKRSDIISTSQPIIRQDVVDKYTASFNTLSVPEVFTPTDLGELQGDNNLIQDPSGQPDAEEINEETIEKNFYSVAYDKSLYSPRDLARYIIDYSRELSVTKNNDQAIQNVLSMNPSIFGLAKTVSGYLASKTLPTSQRYQDVARIYNGKNIRFEDFQIGRNKRGLLEVSGVDETGQRLYLEQNTGLILPSVPGTVFMGPYSANAALPTPDRIEDLFSFFHDYTYKNGGFFDSAHDGLGDLQFVSRLSQNLDRVKPENLQLVYATIIYFSNVSLTLGMLKNKTIGRSDMLENQASISEDYDIYDVIGAPSAENIDMPPVTPEENDILKSNFYDIMNTELQNYTKTDGFFEWARTNSVENMVSNINIQLN